MAGFGLCQALALGALASKFASAAHSFSLLAGLLLRRLFEMCAGFHFPEKAFSLHLLLQRAKGLFDIVVADNDLYDGQISIGLRGPVRARTEFWRETTKVGPISPNISLAYSRSQQ